MPGCPELQVVVVAPTVLGTSRYSRCVVAVVDCQAVLFCIVKPPVEKTARFCLRLTLELFDHVNAHEVMMTVGAVALAMVAMSLYTPLGVQVLSVIWFV